MNRMSEFDPDAEVDGRYIKSFSESAGNVSPVFEKKLKEMLEKHGISDIDADDWYRLEDVVAAMEGVTESVGESTARKGGVEIGRTIPFPDDVSNPKEAFEMLNKMDEQTYRNSTMDRPGGKWTFEGIDNTTVRAGITNAWPYPVPIAEGLVEGVVKTTKKDVIAVDVEKVDPNPEEKSAFRVSW